MRKHTRRGRALRQRYGRAARSRGTIREVWKIMRDAIMPGGAVTYLHDERVLKRLAKDGYVYMEYSYADGTWDKYKATEKGREAFAKGRFPR